MDFTRDSMGREIDPIEEDGCPEVGPEHDGQPDEAQEWYDYDPDC